MRFQTIIGLVLAELTAELWFETEIEAYLGYFVPNNYFCQQMFCHVGETFGNHPLWQTHVCAEGGWSAQLEGGPS